jgi:ABC-type polysaccharide/polyol phosphate export permease
MAGPISTEGQHYFTFLLVGMMTFSFLGAAVNTLPGAVGGGISSGTFEALLATPTRVPTLLSGLMSYAFMWTAIRAVVLLGTGIFFGARYAWGHALPALMILLLIVLAYIPIGLIASGFFVAFRTAGPLPQVAIVLSGLLGGVYWPTRSIPAGIQGLSDYVPLTYGLRALRRTLLEGMPLSAVADDLRMLILFAITLFALGVLTFSLALSYARRAGTLAQY